MSGDLIGQGAILTNGVDFTDGFKWHGCGFARGFGEFAKFGTVIAFFDGRPMNSRAMNRETCWIALDVVIARAENIVVEHLLSPRLTAEIHHGNNVSCDNFLTQYNQP